MSLFIGGARLVLLVGDGLQPLDDPPVELFLDRDVSHGGRGRGTVPVLLTGRARDDVARSYDSQRSAPALHEADAGSDDQRLPERVGMPVAAGAGLEGDAGTARARRGRCLEERVD